MPEVSVVIPSYNHAEYISKAVESVLTQTLGDLELIIVDDGSQDQTLDVLHTVQDSRLRIIEQENQGAHAAINRGLRESCGKYLSILNSDDAYTPDRLQKLLGALEKQTDASLACSYVQLVGEKDQPLGIKHGYHDLEPWLLPEPQRSFRASTDLRAALLTENYCATTSNYLFLQEWFNRVGSFRPLRYVHDWDFALRITRTADLIVLPEPLLYYRVHSRNTIRENQAAMIFEICWVLAVHLPLSVNTGWFQEQPMDVRFDQLLHSVYTFGFDSLLSGLMALNLDENEGLALELLEPDNPIRLRGLEFIQAGLNRVSQQPSNLQLVRRMLGRIKRAVLRR